MRMLSNRLIIVHSRTGLLRSCNLMGKRLIQVSAVNSHKFKRNKFQQDITYEYDQPSQKPDNSYSQRNDSLLNLDDVFRQIDKQPRHDAKKTDRSIHRPQSVSDKRNKQPSHTFEKNDDKRHVFESDSRNKQFNFKSKISDNEREVRKRFIDDVNPEKNYILTNQVVLDGINLINDVIYYEYPKLSRIYYSDEEKLSKINQVDELREDGVEFLKVNSYLIKKYSEVIDPQGVIAIAELDAKKLFHLNMKRNENQIPLILILNKIKDPGNMGTIIRTSLACGINKLLCLEGCAKLLRGKVIRSTAGAVFQMPFIEKIKVGDLANHIPKSARIFLSDSKGVNVDENLRKLTKDAVDDFELKANEIDLECDNSVADHDVGDENNSAATNSIEPNDASDKQSEQLETVIDKSIDMHEMICRLENTDAFNYSDVNYFTSAEDCIVLIANGEIGVTKEILDFIQAKNFTKVHIPLANGTDSLNASVAASVIMFEIRRQYLMKFKK